MNITITHNHWTYARNGKVRDALWIVPLIIFGCGVC